MLHFASSIILYSFLTTIISSLWAKFPDSKLLKSSLQVYLVNHLFYFKTFLIRILLFIEINIIIIKHIYDYYNNKEYKII